MSPATHPLPTNFIARFFRGLSYPFAALRFIRQHGLWGLAVVPAVVNIVLFVAVVAVLIWLVGPWLSGLAASLAPSAATGFWAAVGGFFAKFLAVLLWILVPVAVVAVSAIVIVLIGQAVASPFLDALSEKVEALVLKTPETKVEVGRVLRSVSVAIADIIWTVLFWVAVNLPLLLINLVPIIGSAANAVLSFCFTALLLAQEFVGLSLTRQFVSYPGRWRVIWANRGICLGFGSATMLLLVVPGLNLILLPLATVGGTLLYCDLQAGGRVDAGRVAPPARVL